MTVEANSYVGSRALPTLPNSALNILESFLGLFGISTTKRTKLTIIKNASGIVKPSRYHTQVVIQIVYSVIGIMLSKKQIILV